MTSKKSSLFLFFFALALASMACTIFVGGPDYPEQTITVSENEVLNMHTLTEQAFISGAESGVVTLQFTEAQLTSYIALKLQEQTNPPFSEPQILLRDGQMKLYAKKSSGFIAANILITMNIGIDETSGLPKIEIAEVDFGPIPAPEGINNAISAVIGEAFTGSLGPVATGFRLESISIADGVMTMTGRIK
jgi:hypothetical protein